MGNGVWGEVWLKSLSAVNFHLMALAQGLVNKCQGEGGSPGARACGLHRPRAAKDEAERKTRRCATLVPLSSFTA